VGEGDEVREKKQKAADGTARRVSQRAAQEPEARPSNTTSRQAGPSTVTMGAGSTAAVKPAKKKAAPKARDEEVTHEDIGVERQRPGPSAATTTTAASVEARRVSQWAAQEPEAGPSNTTSRQAGPSTVTMGAGSTAAVEPAKKKAAPKARVIKSRAHILESSDEEGTGEVIRVERKRPGTSAATITAAPIAAAPVPAKVPAQVPAQVPAPAARPAPAPAQSEYTNPTPCDRCGRLNIVCVSEKEGMSCGKCKRGKVRCSVTNKMVAKGKGKHSAVAEPQWEDLESIGDLVGSSPGTPPPSATPSAATSRAPSRAPSRAMSRATTPAPPPKTPRRPRAASVRKAVPPTPKPAHKTPKRVIPGSRADRTGKWYRQPNYLTKI
jgi:hypothetical protein